MNYFWLKILNIFTFGYLSKKIKNKVKQINDVKNNKLTLNTIEKPDINLFLQVFGGKNNIVEVRSTISSLSIVVKELTKVDCKKISLFLKKGISQNEKTFILLLGDCCQSFASDLKKIINS